MILATPSVKAIKDSILGWMFTGHHFGLASIPVGIKQLSKSQLSILSKYFETVKYTSELRTALSFEIAAR